MAAQKMPNQHFTCGFFVSSMNFAIDSQIDVITKPKPEFHAIADYLERGYPTKPTNWLINKLQEQYDNFAWPAQNSQYPLSLKHRNLDWSQTIKGDDARDRYPAQQFLNEAIEKYLPQYGFIKNLIIPECQFKDIMALDPTKHNINPTWAVDFFLPFANLVIEIDGPQHENPSQREKDNKRNRVLTKHGIKTHRLPTYKINDASEELISYFNALRKELETHQEIVEIASRFNAEETIGHRYYYDLTALARLQRTLTELIAAGRLKNKSKVEIACDFSGSIDWVKLAYDDLKNTFEMLSPYFPKKSNFPELDLKLVKNFSEEPSNIKIEISLFKIPDDAYTPRPNAVNVLSVLNSYEYFQTKQRNTVKKRVKVSSCVSVPENFTEHKLTSRRKSAQRFIENTFGISDFRTGQYEIIQSSSSANAVLGLIPTGGGKSLTFQCLGALETGCSIVVCPITALIRDHVLELNQFGFEKRAEYISAEIVGDEREFILQNLDQGKLKFLFLSPEQFQKAEFRTRLKHLGQRSRINRIVIDEVHCISEWGHDFRTAYLNLADTISALLPEVPVLCLTATAALKVIEDIQIEFDIDDDNVLYFMQDSRGELTFNLIETNNKIVVLEKLVRENIENGMLNDQSAFVVFSQLNNDVNYKSKIKPGLPQISAHLRAQYPDFKIGIFSGSKPDNWEAHSEFKHLGLPYTDSENYDTYKQKVQALFKQNKMHGIVATKAFGMGVNKPNIRLAVHYGMPQSMESLYQEAGRAGRDKEPANCITLFKREKKVPDELHDPNTSLEKIAQISKELENSNADLSQQLYFLISSNKAIIIETDECVRELHTAREISKKQKLNELAWMQLIEDQDEESLKRGARTKEKIIYRLKQLGFVKDWTVDDFILGHYSVLWQDQNLDELAASILSTITKYTGEDAEAQKAKYEIEQILLSSSDEKERQLIKLLLTWNYDHFVYQRRQSLKNLYEACENFKDPASFKRQLESYFQVDKTFSTFETLLKSGTTDAIKIIRSLLHTKTGNLRSRNVLENVSGTLSRYLESYQSNPGLNLLSGLLRLEKNEFDDADGENRFISFLDQIKETQDVTMLLSLLTSFNKTQQDKAIKAILSRARNPDIATMIFQQTGNSQAEVIVLEQLNKRLEAIL
ncbi:RecQ family ATP-dependent DNA helicase [Paracoccaceae bacterium]|nr:RecQ family ATP-dependent DNA helicase [Paracoccaceae bacterium]